MNNNFLNTFKNFIIRFDFLFLVVLLLALNVPFMNDTYFPKHDTKQYFEVFYFFYNQLFFHHNIAQWISYEPFGLAASIKQLQFLDVFGYVAMFIGLVFHITNALILYKLSILLDLLIFLFGMYLLSRQLFKSRIITFFICLVALNQATCWESQIQFNLKMFDMLPLTLYLLVLFFDKKRIRYFLLMLLSFTLWLMGSVFYTGAMWEFSVLILAAVFLFNDRQGWKGIFSAPFGKRWLLLTVVLMIAYACLFHDFKIWFDLQPGIRHNNGSLPINNYLVYGGQSVSLSDFFREMLDYHNSHIFLGVMPVFFFFWSLFSVRNYKYYAFLLTTIALWALSFQGIFSMLFYFIVPGLAFYHHLAWFHEIIMVFVIICAGFGLENFLSSTIQRRIAFTALIILVATFFADAVRLSGDGVFALITDWHVRFFVRWIKETNVLFTLAPILLLMVMNIGAWVYERLCLRKQGRRISIKVFNGASLFFIFAIVCLGASKAHAIDYHNFSRINPNLEKYLYTVNVHPVEFSDRRIA